MWRGAIEHTVLHEAFEIICETLGDMRGRPPTPCSQEMCKRADRFAAEVLMQRDTFAVSAQTLGFDVIALHNEFGRSFASVTMRLAEVVDDPPLAAVLYENRLKRSCAGRPLLESPSTVAGEGGVLRARLQSADHADAAIARGRGTAD